MFFTPKAPAKGIEPKAPEIADTFSAPQGAPEILKDAPKSPHFLQPTDLVSDADLAKEPETPAVSQQHQIKLSFLNRWKNRFLMSKSKQKFLPRFNRLLKIRKKKLLCKKLMTFGFPIYTLHPKKSLMSTTESHNSG